jgi:tetratricopeptide (TPR) repeat protein
VLFLHSFEYADAAREFQKAQKADPAFAMAYWGEAMTHTHPVWNEQDIAAARAVLARLGASRSERQAKAPSHREKMYLEAVETLYGEGSKPRRDTLYSAAVKAIVDSHPEDAEAKVFYALSLLGLNQGQRDVATYLRAGQIAEAVFKSNRDHPGAAHYVIHSYDDPDHASLGLEAARAYSKIAPGAAHAQHMTTHIFLALGMWDDVVSQNEIASGHDHGSWTPGHYTSWLHYAYLQQGRYADALHMLEQMLPAQGKTVPPRQQWSLTSMRARHVIESEQWDSAPFTLSSAQAPVPADAASLWAFVSGYRAVRKGDLPGARSELAVLNEANRRTGTGTDPVDIIAELELTAALKFAEGKQAEALSHIQRAAALEDSMPAEFGPPAVVKPSHEMYGEMLLEMNKAADAQHEFERALALAPMRTRSLSGLARAAAANGDKTVLARANADLAKVLHRADPLVRATLARER